MKSLFKSLSTKIVFYFFIATIIMSLLLGYLLSQSILNSFEKEFRNKLLTYAKTASCVIASDEHEKLKTEADMDSLEYKNIKTELQRFQKEMGVKYLYTLRMSGDKYVFVVDTDDQEPALIGEECAETNAVREVFKDKSLVEDDFYTDKWGTFLSAYAPIKNGNGEVIAAVGADVDASTVTDLRVRVRILVLGVFASFAIVLLVLAVVIVGRVMKPVNIITHRMEQVANRGGDLTQRIKINRSDETGRLAAAFNSLFGTLQGIIGKVKDTSEFVMTASGELASSSDNSAGCIDMVAEQTTLLTAEIAEAEKMLNSMNREIEIFSSKSQEIAEKSEELENFSHTSLAMLEDTAESIVISKRLLIELEQLSDSTGKDTLELGEYTDAIANIADTIGSITKQTNMLAINAMIEAQQAGETGKGFAIVAENIRALSQNTQGSAKRIKELVNAVVQRINTVVDEQKIIKPKMEKMVEYFDKINSLINQTVIDFGNAAAMINQISDANSSQASGVQSLVTYADKVCSNFRKQVNTAHDTSAATQELNAMLEEIAANTSMLSETAKELNGMIGNFKI